MTLIRMRFGRRPSKGSWPTVRADRYAVSCAKISTPGASQSLLAHDLDQDALRPQAIELGIDHALPGAQFESAVADRHQHLVMYQQALQVRARIALKLRAVLVVIAVRRDFLQPG